MQYTFGMYNGKRLASSSQTCGGVEGDGGIKRFVLLVFQLNNRETLTQGTELQAVPGCPPELHPMLRSLLGLCPHLLKDWTKSLLWHHLTKPSQPHQSTAFLFLFYKAPGPGWSPVAMSYRGSRALIRLKIDTQRRKRVRISAFSTQRKQSQMGREGLNWGIASIILTCRQVCGGIFLMNDWCGKAQWQCHPWAGSLKVV